MREHDAKAGANASSGAKGQAADQAEDTSAASVGQSAELSSPAAGGSGLKKRMQGAPREVPYRAEMEATFGVDLGDVQVFVGESAEMARRKANAAQSGEIVAFASPTPDKETVTHELTHVLQARLHGGGAAGQSSRADGAEQQARQVAGGAALGDLVAPSAEVMLDESDNVNEARRRALEIKDALLDGWTEDEEKALNQIRGQSTLMLREIRAQYRRVTRGHVLENDFREYCNSDQYREALSILWNTLSLEDRIRTNLEPGWLYDSENEQGMLDVLKTASRAELDRAARNQRVMGLLRSSLSADEWYEASQLLTPGNMYPLVVERIRNARSWWNDDESAVYNVILDLTVAQRRQLWTENEAIFGFMSSGEKARVRRMCMGTEAEALEERLDEATAGLGTDDDAVQLVVERTQSAAQQERQLQAMQRTGVGPDGQPLTEDTRAAVATRLEEIGGVQENLLTPQRDADGDIDGDSFLGDLQGDVGEGEFRSMAGNMGVAQYELAKQRILDAITWYNDDERGIEEAFNALLGSIQMPEATAPADLSAAERAQLQTQANREIRQRLWNDPQVQAALGHLNQSEQDDAAVYASGDTYDIALAELHDAMYAMDSDEERMLRLISEMSPEDRGRLTSEAPPIYIRIMLHFGRDADMVRTVAETGRIPTDRALDWAFGGDWDGTEDEMIAQTFAALTEQERATYRMGYWLHNEGREPADEHQQHALSEFRTLYARMGSELGDDDLQKGMDQLLGNPSPAELQTEEGRLMAAGIMRHRMQDKEALGSGLADAFVSSDETADQAAVQLESAYNEAMVDGVIDADELAVLAALDQDFAARYSEHVANVDMIRNVASTVAAVAAGILVTLATGGAAGPGVAAFLASNGAAVMTGAVAGAVAKVGTAEIMGGDHYDAMSTEGATDAMVGAVDGATAVLSAGLANRFTDFVGLGQATLAAELTGATVRSTSAAAAHIGKSFAAGGVRGAIEGFLSGAVGELVMTLADAQTWRQSIMDVLADAGRAILRGGLIGGATGGTLGGAFEALGAVLSVRRVRSLVTQLEAAGIAGGQLDDLSADTLTLMGRVDDALAQGNTEDAAALMAQLDGKLSADDLGRLRGTLWEHHGISAAASDNPLQMSLADLLADPAAQERLLAMANDAHDEVRAALDRLEGQFDGVEVMSGLKRSGLDEFIASVEEKLTRKGYETVGGMGDMIRGRIEAGSAADVEAIVEDLRQAFPTAEFDIKAGPYPRVHVDIPTANGMRFELQIGTQATTQFLESRAVTLPGALSQRVGATDVDFHVAKYDILDKATPEMRAQYGLDDLDARYNEALRATGSGNFDAATHQQLCDDISDILRRMETENPDGLLALYTKGGAVHPPAGATVRAPTDGANAVDEAVRPDRSVMSQQLSESLGERIKSNPLRQSYEAEVAGLRDQAARMAADGAETEEIARAMHQARRDLGAKYKDLTPEPLRDFIYHVNNGRYGDPLGPSFEFLAEKYGGDFQKIIEGSTRPNPDVDRLLASFRTWLDEQPADALQRYLDAMSARQSPNGLAGTFHPPEVGQASAAAGDVATSFQPPAPVQMSPAHSMETITAGTRFGGGNRNSVKTVARRGVDVNADLVEITAGQAALTGRGDILTSSGRVYGQHPGTSTVFLRSGSPGTIDLSQAEFQVLRQMVQEGGLQGNAQRALDGMLRAGNNGVGADSADKLQRLFGQ